MITHMFLFAVSLFLVIKGATLATRYATLIAQSFQLSRYTVGFLIVAVISILPETFIALNAALEGIPEFGLSTLMGANVADLTLIVALVVLFARRSVRVESRIMRTHALYPFLLLVPIMLGFDGNFSRLEGVALIIAGSVFYYLTLRQEGVELSLPNGQRSRRQYLLALGGSMAILLAGAHFVVASATAIATALNITPLLIGMFVVAIGTTIPELSFSIRAVNAHDDSLAIGDILGTVLADMTIVIGLLAFILPFSFPKVIIYVAGVFLVAASFILFSFMRSGRVITRREAFALVVLWITFASIQWIVHLV